MLDDLRGPLEAVAGIPFDEAVALRQGRPGRPEEIADAVCFLASDDTPFTTGSHPVPDGGLTASLP
jgi:NAD(P)-dependent dehydrogenase (short-subunit alcohol dehydrogenase family)